MSFLARPLRDPEIRLPQTARAGSIHGPVRNVKGVFESVAQAVNFTCVQGKNLAQRRNGRQT